MGDSPPAQSARCGSRSKRCASRQRATLVAAASISDVGRKLGGARILGVASACVLRRRGSIEAAAASPSSPFLLSPLPVSLRRAALARLRVCGHGRLRRGEHDEQ
eukprot:8310385-Alexandrium_andersonii.AAC.1